jgi:hypothetical protein
MQTRALSNRAVFRGSVTFQTELETGIVLSGTASVKSEVPLDEQQLRTVVFRPVDVIDGLLSTLCRTWYGREEMRAEESGVNGHSKQEV